MMPALSTATAGTRIERPTTKRGVLDDVREYVRLTKLHGGMLPISAVAVVLGLSRQRVHQLIDEGTFSVFEFYGMKWLLAKEVIPFSKLNRRAGENQFRPSVKEMWKVSHEAGKEFMKNRRSRRGS
jgi:hypothetical protein